MIVLRTEVFYVAIVLLLMVLNTVWCLVLQNVDNIITVVVDISPLCSSWSPPYLSAICP